MKKPDSRVLGTPPHPVNGAQQKRSPHPVATAQPKPPLSGAVARPPHGVPPHVAAVAQPKMASHVAAAVQPRSATSLPVVWPHPATAPRSSAVQPALNAAARVPIRPHGSLPGATAGVAQPWLGAAVAAVGSAASYVPYVAVAAGVAYAVNTITESRTGRNIVGHLSYFGQDPVVQEVMDLALQNGIKPFSTQTFNNYSFKVDRFCRTYEVSGYVSRRTYGRVQGAIAPLVKATGDQNGHIIADSLNGPPHSINFIGMSARQNNAVGAAVDDDTWSRVEGAVRRIVDGEERYYDNTRRVHVPFSRIWIQVKLSYPAWNALSRNTKLDYFRPNRLDVRVIAYANRGQSQEYDNPYLPNAEPGHMDVRDIRVGGDYVNDAPGVARYLIGEPGYPH